MIAIDSTDVQLLQSRAPRASHEDMLFLRKHFEAGRLFSSLEKEVRQQLWVRVQQRSQTMPGFFTFFKDFNFLSILQSVVKHLVVWPPPKSLSQSLESDYHPRGATYVQCEHRERVFERCRTAPKDNFKKSYLQLWLFAMRHWWETTRFRHRKAGKGYVVAMHELLLLPYLADLALEIGFTSSKIQKLAQSSRNDTIPSTQPQTNIMVGTSMRQRCGIPFLREQASDQGNLFLSRVLDPAIPEGISSLFLRQCFISAFWYDMDDDAATTEGGEVHESTPLLDDLMLRHFEEARISTYYTDAVRRHASVSDGSVYEDCSFSSESGINDLREENKGRRAFQETVRFWIFDGDRGTIQEHGCEETLIQKEVNRLAREDFLVMTTHFMCLTSGDAFRALSESNQKMLLFCTPSHQSAARVAYAVLEDNIAVAD